MVIRRMSRINNYNQSCGCAYAEFITNTHITHGQSKTKTYKLWAAMKARCNPTDIHHRQRYYNRGISVCPRWQLFINFLADMGECPPGLTLDRIDNDKGYEPGNCRWTTPSQQGRNRSNCRFLTFNGKTQTVSAWAEELGISRYKILGRLRAGHAIEWVLNTEKLTRSETIKLWWSQRKQ